MGKTRYYKPILQAIAEGYGQEKRKDVLERVREILQISDEEMNELTEPRDKYGEGKRYKVKSDYDNAIYDLRVKGLVMKGENCLTEKGKEYVRKLIVEDK